MRAAFASLISLGWGQSMWPAWAGLQAVSAVGPARCTGCQHTLLAHAQPVGCSPTMRFPLGDVQDHGAGGVPATWPVTLLVAYLCQQDMLDACLWGSRRFGPDSMSCAAALRCPIPTHLHTQPSLP